MTAEEFYIKEHGGEPQSDYPEHNGYQVILFMEAFAEAYAKHENEKISKLANENAIGYNKKCGEASDLQKQVEKLEAELKGQRDGEWQEIVSLQRQVDAQSCVIKGYQDRIDVVFKENQAPQKQCETLINFAKDVIEYWEKYDIGDEDIYHKAKQALKQYI